MASNLVDNTLWSYFLYEEIPNSYNPLSSNASEKDTTFYLYEYEHDSIHYLDCCLSFIIRQLSPDPYSEFDHNL
jgi:hypothetical protein